MFFLFLSFLYELLMSFWSSRKRLPSVGHFRVPSGLCIKTRFSAQPLIWKCFSILLQIKLIFTKRLGTWPHFESEGFWNSEVAYWFIMRGRGLQKAHSRKRPAVGTTTFSNFRGGRLRELRLYLYVEDKKIIFADRLQHLFVKNSLI